MPLVGMYPAIPVVYAPLLSIFSILEYRKSMLKPQDLLVLLRLVLVPAGGRATFQELSVELGISASQVHASVKRAALSGLLNLKTRVVNRRNLLEFLVHGAKYSFPARFTTVTRGVPTSHAALPLSKLFAASELPPVWAHPEGTVRGEGLEPLYSSAPDAALRNPELHEWLALLDAVRAGRARERALAIKELTKRLSA